MGEVIVALLSLFADRWPDAESPLHVSELAANPRRWSAGHAVFDEIRERRNAAERVGNVARSAQAFFEESCCQTLYNASHPGDPFDADAPFWVAGSAIGLARVLGVSVESVVRVLAPESSPGSLFEVGRG